MGLHGNRSDGGRRSEAFERVNQGGYPARVGSSVHQPANGQIPIWYRSSHSSQSPESDQVVAGRLGVAPGSEASTWKRVMRRSGERGLAPAAATSSSTPSTVASRASSHSALPAGRRPGLG